MADVRDAEIMVAMEDANNLASKNLDDVYEPASKRLKLDEKDGFDQHTLEERLNEILRCVVCYDLPNLTFYQCTNGHLMCSSCLLFMLAECRKQKEKASCPQCSCELSRTLCCRNLVVEKAISEMPISCPFCEQLLPRSSLSFHKRDQCPERPVLCKYASIGCEWTGPFHSHLSHEASCTFPDKTGWELIGPVLLREQAKIKEVRMYKSLLDLLSCEDLEFVDFRLEVGDLVTDDSPPDPTYMTSRFKAHSFSWTFRASNSSTDQENTPSSTPRTLAYKLKLRTKPPAPTVFSYFLLRGPYSAISLDPVVHKFMFSEDVMETPYHDFPCCDQFEARSLVKSRFIKLRLGLIQVKK